MRRKVFFFCLIILIGVFLIRKIPINLLFDKTEWAVYSKNLKEIILGALIIGGCVLVAKWKGLLAVGGFVNAKTKNFWMLLIPVIFPGLAFITDFDIRCFDEIAVLIFSTLAIFVMALMEETVFRGVIQGYITRQYPAMSNHHKCLITASLFSLIHFSNLQYYELIGVIQQVVFAFYMGLLLSALLIRTNSVWMLGVTHAVLNVISFRCAERADGIDTIETSASSYIGFSGLANILGVVLILSPTLIVYWFLLRTAKPGTKYI
jgi:membrane protease YdiL (CAAX protease family)